MIIKRCLPHFYHPSSYTVLQAACHIPAVWHHAFVVQTGANTKKQTANSRMHDIISFNKYCKPSVCYYYVLDFNFMNTSARIFSQHGSNLWVGLPQKDDDELVKLYKITECVLHNE